MVSISDSRFFSLIGKGSSSKGNHTSFNLGLEILLFDRLNAPTVTTLAFMFQSRTRDSSLWSVLSGTACVVPLKCFNLGLEILLFDRWGAENTARTVESVSISDSRFFSLIEGNRSIKSLSARYVSISDSRFFSLIGMRLEAFAYLYHWFQSRTRDSSLWSQTDDSWKQTDYHGFNLGLEILLFDRRYWNSRTEGE